jgi:hypothetical protein
VATGMEKLLAIKELYLDLLVVVGTVIENPTQANIEAAILAINAGTYTGVFVPRLNYSLDGKSVSWSQFHAQLMSLLKEINTLIQQESLCWVVTSRARP